MSYCITYYEEGRDTFQNRVDQVDRVLLPVAAAFVLRQVECHDFIVSGGGGPNLHDRPDPEGCMGDSVYDVIQ